MDSKTYVLVALLSAALAGFTFAIMFRVVVLATIVAQVPGITDLVWTIAQAPIKLLGLPQAGGDWAGFTIQVASLFYGSAVFVAVNFIFIVVAVRRRRLRNEMKWTEHLDS